RRSGGEDDRVRVERDTLMGIVDAVRRILQLPSLAPVDARHHRGEDRQRHLGWVVAPEIEPHGGLEPLERVDGRERTALVYGAHHPRRAATWTEQSYPRHVRAQQVRYEQCIIVQRVREEHGAATRVEHSVRDESPDE